jgi:hypothetical protein
MDSSLDLQSQAEMAAIDRLIAEAELAVSAAPCHDELLLSPARPETLTEQQTERHAGLQCEKEAAAAPNEPRCNSVAPHIGMASEPSIDSHLAPVPLLRIPAEYSEDGEVCLFSMVVVPVLACPTHPVCPCVLCCRWKLLR